MSIPHEAIIAAANSISESQGMRFDGFWSRVEDLEPADRQYALTEAYEALAAALPHLWNAVADSWDGCADEAVECNLLHQGGADLLKQRNPHRSSGTDTRGRSK